MRFRSWLQVLNNIHILQEVGMGIVFFISGITLNTKELSKVSTAG